LFITKTLNPNDPEIRRFLKPGQTFMDRPDVCARVAEIRFSEFLRDITKRHIMGVVDGYVWVKEYQKRGLPHWHCIFWLNERDKFATVDDVDRFIRADIPDPEVEPELYRLVCLYHLHGPCTRNMACMKNSEECSKKYPKPYSPITRIRPGCFPNYRRVRNGRIVMRRGRALTNQNVVPYNPYLLLKYQCHINVEVVSFLMCLMYIFKYVCKGNDRVAIQMDQPVPNQNVFILDDNIGQSEINQNVTHTIPNVVDEVDGYIALNVDNVVPLIPERPTRAQAYDEIRDYLGILFIRIIFL
jgi:hypothetical protein